MLHIARTLMMALIFGLFISSGHTDDSVESKNVVALFKGEDRDSSTDCFLHVLSESRQQVDPLRSAHTDNCDGYSATVITGYVHEGNGPGRIVLTHPNSNAEMLTGEIPENSIELRAARTGATACGYAGMTVFSLRWLHADHYDTVTCRNLVQIY